MTSRWRRRAALFLLFTSIVAWPVTAFTTFRHEPQGILGLSWFAIVIGAVDILATAEVKETAAPSPPPSSDP